MNGFLNHFFSIVALILMGVFAAFLVLLNKVKDDERRKENEDGKTKQ